MGFLRRKKNSDSSFSVTSYGEVIPSREYPPTPRSPVSASEKEVDIEAHSNLSSRRTSSTTSTGATTMSSYSSTIPTCKVCGLNGTREVTRHSNRNNNNNAGRKYWKCYPCNKFMMWDESDDIGLSDVNPMCHCGVSSRAGISGQAKGRKIFYNCRFGKCDFYSFRKDEAGNVLPGVTEDIADVLRSMRLA